MLIGWHGLGAPTMFAFDNMVELCARIMQDLTLGCVDIRAR